MSVIQRDLGRANLGHITPPKQPGTDWIAHTGEKPRVPGNGQQRLEAAIRRNAELLETCSLLTEKVSLLVSQLAQANRLAHYDELTGLPNRRLLLDRFNQATALADRHCQQIAMLFFDVNSFKRVNDQLGHVAGDTLLQQVATRLASSIRRSDTACRYGGDEFVALLSEIHNREHAIATLKKIRERLAQPYEIDCYSLRLSVSDGLAIYPKDAQSFSDLVRLADRLMFGNKSGRAPELNVWLHDVGMEACAKRR